MTEAFPPEQFLKEVERRHDAMCMKGYFERNDAGKVKGIKKTVGALAGEFGRLEALYKVDKEYFIPHPEKSKLYELAVDTAALCMMLCEGTIQSRRQAQLILEQLDFSEDVDRVTSSLNKVASVVLEERKQKLLDEELERAQRAKEEAEQNAKEVQESVKAKKSKKVD